MSDYIKREDAIRSIADHDEFKGERWIKEAWADYMIEEAPTIDAVPVVRCKDCKHRIKWKESYGCSFWGYYGDEFADGEMFCSKGERRKERR